MTKQTRSSSFPQTLEQAVIDEIEEERRNGNLGDGYRTVPQCHVCCEIESKDLVNKLIAANLTNREIAETCSAINQRRAANDDERVITPRSVLVHRKNHFNVDDPAKAVLRAIVERRALAENYDVVNGTGHIVTPYAVMEVGMVKGMADMMQDDTHLTPKETLEFAKALHEFTNRDAGQRKMADLLYAMDRIIMAAQRFIPVEQHRAFLAAVEGTDDEVQPMQQITKMVAEKAEGVIREFTPSKSDEGDEF